MRRPNKPTDRSLADESIVVLERQLANFRATAERLNGDDATMMRLRIEEIERELERRARIRGEGPAPAPALALPPPRTPAHNKAVVGVRPAPRVS